MYFVHKYLGVKIQRKNVGSTDLNFLCDCALFLVIRIL